MFNEATFREILLPSPDNINNYATLIYGKYGEEDENNKEELQTRVKRSFIIRISD